MSHTAVNRRDSLTIRKILVDDFVDPQGWLNETRIDAAVTGVRMVGEDLLIELSYQDKESTITLSENHLKTLALSQVDKILTKYRGNYLLRALSHRIDASD